MKDQQMLNSNTDYQHLPFVNFHRQPWNLAFAYYMQCAGDFVLRIQGFQVRRSKGVFLLIAVKMWLRHINCSHGLVVKRITSNDEILGSTPSVSISFLLLLRLVYSFRILFCASFFFLRFSIFISM